MRRSIKSVSKDSIKKTTITHTFISIFDNFLVRNIPRQQVQRPLSNFDFNLDRFSM